MEQNQQGSGQGRGRRGNFHRGRRGPDRRGPGPQEKRSSQPSEAQSARGEHVDVEHIMRDIRARIAQRHGIDLSAQQIQELAARRLEAVLDPRNINPSLLEQLRKAAGARQPGELATTPPAPAYTFEDTTLYETHRGLLRTIRRLLNPILRLFFNPDPITHALHVQARLNAEQAAREVEREGQQAEWNALHYELLRRVVAESAKLSIEVQTLTLRVESLSTRVDFADRRVRALEAAPAPRQGGGRPVQEAQQAAPPAALSPGEPRADSLSPVPAPDGSSVDGQRKRRRRRRGRRSGVPFGEGAQLPTDASAQSDQGSEEFDDAPGDAADAGEEGDADTLPFLASTDITPAPAEPPVRSAGDSGAELEEPSAADAIAGATAEPDEATGQAIGGGDDRGPSEPTS